MKSLAVFIALLPISGTDTISSLPPDACVYDEQEEIVKLIKALEDDEIQVRDDATKKLIAIGEPALKDLRKAAQSSDADVKHRANAIIATIEVKRSMPFSPKLMGWYPSIYEEIGQNNTSVGLHNIFCKITEWDQNNNRRLHDIDNQDIAHLVKLMCQDKYMGLSDDDKLNIVNRVKGTNGSGQGEIIYQAISYLIPFLTEENGALHDTAALVISYDQSKEMAELLLPLLQDKNPYVRVTAMRALGFNFTEYTQEIDNLLSDKNDHVRMATVGTLTSLHETRYGKRIAVMLSDESADVRCAAIEYLQSTQPAPTSIDAISPLLKDNDPYVRSGAIKALGVLGARHTAPDIAALLKDEDSAVRLCAALALGELKAREFAKEIALLLKDDEEMTRMEAVHALGELKAIEYVKELLPLLNGDNEIVYVTLLTLRKMRARGIMKDILPLLKKHDAILQSIALSIIADTGSAEDCKDIIPLLNDPARHVYTRAFKTIGKMMGKGAEKDILPYLKDQERRLVAVSTLAQIDATGAAKEIAPMLNVEEDIETREFAIQALGIFKAREYARNIAPFIDDEDQDLRFNAITTLGDMGASEYGDKLASLLKKSKEEEGVDDETVCTLLTALGKIGNRSNIDSIAKYLGSPSSSVQCAAALALCKLGGKEYAPKLIPLLFDTDDYAISCAAMETLCRLKAVETIGEIRSRTKAGTFTPYSVMAVGALGTKDDENLLLSLFKDNVLNIRPSATIALIELGCRGSIPSEKIPEIVEELKSMLASDQSESVMSRIENGLRQLGMTQEDIDIFKELNSIENEGD